MAFRNRLRIASQERQRSMTDTLVDALDALRREEFFDAMEKGEANLRADPETWTEYVEEVQLWDRASLADRLA